MIDVTPKPLVPLTPMLIGTMLVLAKEFGDKSLVLCAYEWQDLTPPQQDLAARLAIKMGIPLVIV